MNLAIVLVLWKYIIFFIVEKKHLIKALILRYNDKLFFHKMQSLLYGWFWRHRSNGILYINKLTYFVTNRKILQEKVYKEVIARFSTVFWIIYIDSWKSIALIQLYIFPFFGLYPTIWDSIHIALIFTVVSIIRSAIWRNFFRKIWKQ